jgi:hypothetical protein
MGEMSGCGIAGICLVSSETSLGLYFAANDFALVTIRSISFV